MNSSCGGGSLLTVSSVMIVSLLLDALRGGGGVGDLVRSRRIDCSIISLSELDGGRRGEDRREGAFVRRRTTPSSMTDEAACGCPPRPKQVYMSQRMRRKPATEPKTMPTTVPGAGSESRPA